MVENFDDFNLDFYFRFSNSTLKDLVNIWNSHFLPCTIIVYRPLQCLINKNVSNIFCFFF